MKKTGNKMKKRISLFVATILAAGAALPLVNYVTEVRADTPEPSVRYFAEANRLVDLSMGGSDETLVRFGQKGQGQNAEWYIIGKDENIKGTEGNTLNNVILFSAQSYGDTVYQNRNNQEEIDLQRTNGEYPPGEKDDGTQYPSSNTDVKYDKINANHYGASSLRTQLANLAIGTNFSAVKNLMLPTTLEIYDVLNNDTYTISQPLYVPAMEDNSTKLLFGSEYDIAKDATGAFGPMWTVLKSNTTTKTESYVFESTVSADGNVSLNSTLTDVQTPSGIYPAFALDLTQVLFASVVERGMTLSNTAATINKDENKSLLLRLNGTNRNFGSGLVDVAYNVSEISYKNAPANSKIIVQGRGLASDSTKDDVEWYWCSGQLSGNSSISTTEVSTAVMRELGASQGSGQTIDFSKCKIWLETTTELGGMPYAVMGHEGIVDKIVLTGVDVPEAGKTLDVEADVDSETRGIKDTRVAISWLDKDGRPTTQGDYDQTYTASVTVNLDSGYDWADDDTLEQNTVIRLADGQEITCDRILKTDNQPGIRTLVFTYTIGPNRKIEYDVYFDGKLVENPALGIDCVYDGQEHSVSVVPTSTGALNPQYSFEEASVNNNVNDWTGVALRMEDAGDYKIYFRIATDDAHDPVDATTDSSAEKPISVKIQKRKVWIHPESQEIPWTKDLTINQSLYEMKSGNGNPTDPPLIDNHTILNLTLTPQMGAVINKDGIISEGWIFFYPTKKNEDGEEEYTYSIWDRDNQKDVTKNYDIQQDAPGKLTVLHNENLPPESITVEKSKTTYTLGEALLVNDIKVTARYGDGYTELVPKGGGQDSITTNEEDIDMTTLGGKTLTITYTREEPEAARGSASATLTLNVVEEEEPDDSQNSGNDNNNGNNGNDDNNDNNNNNSSNGTNTPNTQNSSGNATTTPTTRAANTTTSGSDTTSGTGTTSGTNGTTDTNNSTTASGARTGDTSPIVGWVLAALCSGIVVVSLMIFNISRRTKKRKAINKK